MWKIFLTLGCLETEQVAGGYLLRSLAARCHLLFTSLLINRTHQFILIGHCVESSPQYCFLAQPMYSRSGAPRRPPWSTEPIVLYNCTYMQTRDEDQPIRHHSRWGGASLWLHNSERHQSAKWHDFIWITLYLRRKRTLSQFFGKLLFVGLEAVAQQGHHQQQLQQQNQPQQVNKQFSHHFSVDCNFMF
jgi:hypothetical protein